MDLARIVDDFARALAAADARRPAAVNQRSKVAFKAGIGPHSESAATALVLEEMALADSAYREHTLNVSYPRLPRQRCDVCFGTAPDFKWAIEIKLLRLMGDNGKPNDNMLMHVLSPYPEHRSALTDCTKLLTSGLQGRKAIMIYGFEHDHWPLGPAIHAFELLARERVRLRDRMDASTPKLVHPVHSFGRVFGWEIEPL